MNRIQRQLLFRNPRFLWSVVTFDKKLSLLFYITSSLGTFVAVKYNSRSNSRILFHRLFLETLVSKTFVEILQDLIVANMMTKRVYSFENYGFSYAFVVRLSKVDKIPHVRIYFGHSENDESEILPLCMILTQDEFTILFTCLTWLLSDKMIKYMDDYYNSLHSCNIL